MKMMIRKIRILQLFKEPNKKLASINSFRDFANHKGLTKEILMEVLRVCKERYGSNVFEKLGIEKYYGGKKSGAIIYGIIEKIYKRFRYKWEIIYTWKY